MASDQASGNSCSGEFFFPEGADQNMGGDEIVRPAKDFLHRVAKNMGKQPEDFQKYVEILEENMFDTVESLNLLTEADLRYLKFPLGLVKNILKKIASSR